VATVGGKRSGHVWTMRMAVWLIFSPHYR